MLLVRLDPDGDTITKYKVKDTTGINSFYVSGSAVNATGVNGYEFAANALSTLSVKGDASTGTQTLQIAAYDGTAWSDWTDFILTTTAPNNLPTVTMTPPSLLNFLTFYKVGENGFSITYKDADGDAATVPDEDIRKQQ